MDRAFEKRLREELARASEICRGWWEESESAKQRSDTELYLTRRMDGSKSLGDYHWLLGEQDMARHWYRILAETLLESYRWFPIHAPAVPIDSMLPYDAIAIVEAGMMEQAREFLVRSHHKQLERGARMDQNDMRAIGLAAAQIGFTELVPAVEYYIDAQRRMLSATAARRRDAFALFLRHVWVQAYFLLGDYGACRVELAKVLEAEERVREQKVKIYDSSLAAQVQFEMAHGLEAVIDLVEGEGDRRELERRAKAHLGKAVQISYRLEYIMYETYLKRLYLYMAQDAIEGRKPNPNPFAAG